LRNHYRGSARAIPLFDGLQMCLEQFSTDPSHDDWIKQAGVIKDTYYKSSKIWTGNEEDWVERCESPPVFGDDGADGRAPAVVEVQQ
jgi:hypothetical protein